MRVALAPAAAALTAAALVLPALPANAAAQPAPSIAVATTQGSKPGKPELRYTYALPQLKNASAKATKVFAAKVNALVAAEEKALRKAKGCKAKAGDAAWAELTATAKAAVYQSRYASATIVFEGARPHCDGFDYGVPRSVTIDLKTAKSVAFAKFVDPNGRQFRSAVLNSLPKQNPACAKDKALRQLTPTAIGAAHAWNVSAGGVRVWYAGSPDVGGACSTLTGYVPWKYALKPGDVAKQKTKTTYWVSKLAPSAKSPLGYTGVATVIVVKGKRIAVHTWNLATDKGGCKVGVRSGKKAYVWAVKAPYGRSTLALTSKTATAVPKSLKASARKATAEEQAAVFTAFNGLSAKSVVKACQL
jgi:hypothetical protein